VGEEGLGGGVVVVVVVDGEVVDGGIGGSGAGLGDGDGSPVGFLEPVAGGEVGGFGPAFCLDPEGVGAGDLEVALVGGDGDEGGAVSLVEAGDRLVGLFSGFGVYRVDQVAGPDLNGSPLLLRHITLQLVSSNEA
jgi:hypothetical protein